MSQKFDLEEKLRFYVITDRRMSNEVKSVRLAIGGGATAIQLRIKDASTREMVNVGTEIRKITRDFNVLFIVDDRVDVALAVEADGVHVGQDDMPLKMVKRIAPNLIVGVSASSLREAIEAEKGDADYIGAGAIFPTATKSDAKILGLVGLKTIISAVKIPVIAIGGVNHQNVVKVLKSGVDGIAAVSAIVGASDIRESASRMRTLIDNYFRKTR